MGQGDAVDVNAVVRGLEMKVEGRVTPGVGGELAEELGGPDSQAKREAPDAEAGAGSQEGALSERLGADVVVVGPVGDVVFFGQHSGHG